jgi:hypothetical protein
MVLKQQGIKTACTQNSVYQNGMNNVFINLSGEFVAHCSLVSKILSRVVRQNLQFLREIQNFLFVRHGACNINENAEGKA